VVSRSSIRLELSTRADARRSPALVPDAQQRRNKRTDRSGQEAVTPADFGTGLGNTGLALRSCLCEGSERPSTWRFYSSPTCIARMCLAMAWWPMLVCPFLQRAGRCIPSIARAVAASLQTMRVAFDKYVPVAMVMDVSRSVDELGMSKASISTRPRCASWINTARATLSASSAAR
jgi:hypothetical protein